MMSKKQVDEMLTISCVAARVGFSVFWIRKLEIQGIVIPRRDSIGRRIYNESDVQRLLEYRKRLRPDRGCDPN